MGSVAPACGMMNSMSGCRSMVPLSTRSTTARVVSKKNSSIGRGRPSDVCSQHAGDVGWMNSRAPRRSSSRKTGSNVGVAQVRPTDVREQDEPVDVEVVAAVGDLGDGGVDVRQRKRGEQPEPTGMVDHGPPTVLVHLAGEVDGGRARRRGAPPATRSTAATWRCPADPSPPGARRPTTPGSRAFRRAGRGQFVEQGGPVAVRDVVGVDVDLHVAHRSMR